VNDYEGAMLAERTGRTLADIAGEVEALVVTRGGHGSIIYASGEQIEVAAVPPARVVDPTGCGDAYRAGLLYGIMNGLDWENAAQIASTLATYKLEHHGGQNHRPSRVEIFERCARAFRTILPVTD
jgi:adenosine kinase